MTLKKIKMDFIFFFNSSVIGFHEIPEKENAISIFFFINSRHVTIFLIVIFVLNVFFMSLTYINEIQFNTKTNNE